ncbi:MAG TPA: hypothetical protein VLT88_07100, partial [Desulfosarcina sp.]|nr:hypothetical protein [Desulfosarcina sp.]
AASQDTPRVIRPLAETAIDSRRACPTFRSMPRLRRMRTAEKGRPANGPSDGLLAANLRAATYHPNHPVVVHDAPPSEKASADMDDTVFLNLVKMTAEQHGCRIAEVDLENHTINLDGPDELLDDCARAIAELMAE